MTRATHSPLCVVLGSILAAPLLACEFSEQLDPDGLADGSTGDAASTGDDGEMSGTTVGSSDGAASVSSTSATATAGDDTTADGPGCDPGVALLTLEIDGIQNTVQYEPGGTRSSAIGTEIQLADDGAIHLRAQPDDLSSLQAAGYLRLPPDAPADPDNWFCFDEASTYFDGGEDIIAFEMSGLAKRGACPGGVPVEGSITVCLAHESCGGEWLLEASIGAETFSEQDVAYSTTDIGEVTSFAIDVGNQPAGAGGQLGFRTAAIGDGGGTLQLPVEASYFIVPLGQPDGGAIYCGGQGSSVTHDDGVTASVELVDLTRLGSCADDEANGSGAYCSNLGE